MCAGGCFCSVETKLRSEEELKNGGKRKEVEEGRWRVAFATCLPLVVRRPLTPGLGGNPEPHERWDGWEQAAFGRFSSCWALICFVGFQRE